MLQVDANDQPLVNVADAKINLSDLQTTKQLGTIAIKGEIVDPKCFFGVMKPGEGKPHKDCAIRCILGGIPPVLKVTNEEGRQNYYLIVGANGEKMNEAVQDYVGAQVHRRRGFSHAAFLVGDRVDVGHVTQMDFNA